MTTSPLHHHQNALIALIIANIYNTCAIFREGKWRTIFCVYARKGTYQSNVGLCFANFKLSTTNWYISR